MILRSKSVMTAAATAPLALAALPVAAPAMAQVQYRQEITNNLSRCTSDKGPAAYVTVDGVKSSQGKIRVQAYRGVEQDWLEKGRWLSRIEVPAKAGTMTFCVPLPAAGTFGIAVRHDANGNGKTDLSQDGGGMSNNPSLNIFNLGKPNYRKTAFTVSGGVQSIRIRMRYM